MIKTAQTTAWQELLTILLVRLSFLWILVLISILTPWDDAAFYAFMAIAFIITIPYSLWLRNRMRTQQFAPLQFLVDLVLVTGLIYFTGGINSDLTLLYPLVILSAGIVSRPRQAAEITLLSIIMYVLMASLLSRNILIEYLPAHKATGTPNLNSTLALRVFIFALFGALSVYLSKRCGYINQQKLQSRMSTEDLLNGLSTNALLLDPKGRILHANDTACETLGARVEELCSQTFADLRAENETALPTHYANSIHLNCGHHPPLPVSYRKKEVQLPTTSVPGMDEDQGRTNLTLVVFEDISKPLSIERQLHKMKQVSTATRIAGDLAHEIRTPLTSISTSIQLLKEHEEQTRASDWLPGSQRKKDRTELFKHITSAYSQMEDLIQNFIDLTEYCPDDLISIIKLDSIEENTSYIGQLNTIARGFKNGPNSDSG